MSTELETLALIAAAVSKELRARLDAADFHPSRRSLVDALKAEKGTENRQAVQRWLANLGVDWDGKTPIGEAILGSLVDLKKRQRAKTALDSLVVKLRYPALAGPQGTVEATKLAEAIQGVISELGNSHRKPDS